MITTEKEAGTKWCPMVRFVRSNPHLRVQDYSECIGSRCAMWRWFWSAEKPRFKVAAPGGRGTVPDSWTFCAYNEDDGYPAGWAEPMAEAQARRKGFCGLAGRPGFE